MLSRVVQLAKTSGMHPPMIRMPRPACERNAAEAFWRWIAPGHSYCKYATGVRLSPAGRNQNEERSDRAPLFNVRESSSSSLLNNAFIELREATEVRFVGYSRPDADYHFRALLLRAIRPTTRIRVFLSPTCNPTGYSSAAERENLRYSLSQSRPSVGSSPGKVFPPQLVCVARTPRTIHTSYL